MNKMNQFFVSLWMALLASFLVASTQRPIHVFMAGDSTMADKVLFKSVKDSITGETFNEPFLERGWGQLLPEFVNSKAIVANYAKNGRSTRTFVEEGWWSKIIDNVQKGDFVVLQFGHNDSSVAKADRYTNPVQFRLNFLAFVDEIRARGGIPILCTPVARRKFNQDGVLQPTHGVYPDIIRRVAREKGTLLIDMELKTSQWLQSAGVKASAAFFHKYPPGVSRLYPKGLDDNTHFNEEGARVVAQIFMTEMSKAKNRTWNKIQKTQ